MSNYLCYVGKENHRLEIFFSNWEEQNVLQVKDIERNNVEKLIRQDRKVCLGEMTTVIRFLRWEWTWDLKKVHICKPSFISEKIHLGIGLVFTGRKVSK